MSSLKLIALDAEDLSVVSAHVQDAVAKVGDIAYEPARKLFTLAMNRFSWETSRTGWLFRKGEHQRRRAALSFSRVLSVQAAGIDREKPDTVLSLLAVRFASEQAPAGTVELVFSGGATIRLSVECIEARLSDLGGAWEAASRPAHRA
jgi:hypothetical protein